jgi:DNA-binding protein H-NS
MRALFYAESDSSICSRFAHWRKRSVARIPAIISLTNLSWLDELNLQQLTKVAEAIRAEIDKKREEEKALLREELLEKASLLRVDPRELLRSRKGRGGTRVEVKPKYRDKRDPTLTWSGRGRIPRWLQERIKAGEDKDDYLIR